MTEEEFEEQWDSFNFDDDYGAYIMNNASYGIGNGDMLIRAMEKCYLFDEFKEHIMNRNPNIS